jgi:hypothetical protein
VFRGKERDDQAAAETQVILMIRVTICVVCGQVLDVDQFEREALTEFQVDASTDLGALDRLPLA